MVRITGVLPDTNPIIVISVLREFSGYDLASAKDLWDRVASGEVVMVSVRHAMDIACADALTRCGVEAEATNRKEILREIHERDYRTYDPEVYWSVLKDDLENQIRTWSDRVDELQRLWPGEEPGNAAELVQRLEALRPFASELLKRHSVRCLYPWFRTRE